MTAASSIPACWHRPPRDGKARRGLAAVALLIPGLVAALAAVACAPKPPAPARGVVLLSIDTLRADHLGCYGYPLATSPFLDSLAARGTLFEAAYVQLPGTLPSHMSMLTGLYPEEHGVRPPDGVLPEDIPLLAEILQRAGFATAGHTEGGYVDGSYGFSRGFAEFSDAADGGILTRARQFLAGRDRSRPFFLFLHTYAVHDPYFPTAEALADFWPRPHPETPAPTGPNLVDFNRGRWTMSQEALDFYRASYDASIRDFDGELRAFFEEMEPRGLLDDTVVIVTSDHGEEFREHGKMVHEQVYPETLHVPLLILDPRRPGPRRIPAIVQGVDTMPTVLELLGVPVPAGISGRSLVPWLGAETTTQPERAFSVDVGGRVRTLVQDERASRWMLRVEEAPQQKFIASPVEIDSFGRPMRVEIRSFYAPRRLRVEVDGKLRLEHDLDPDRWDWLDVPVAADEHRVRFVAESCTVPAEVGVAADRNCLAFEMRKAPLVRLELFDLGRDPLAGRDVAFAETELRRRLVHDLLVFRPEPRSGTRSRLLGKELEARLRALGYLQD